MSPVRMVVVLAALASYLAASTLQASSILWNLNGGGTWNTTAANWTGDSTTFTDDGTVNVTFTNPVNATITIAANMSPLSTTVDSSSIINFKGGPIDSGFLVKAGTGRLRLNNANTYPGGTWLKAGELWLFNNTAAGPGTITLGDSSGDADATLYVNANSANPIAVQSGSTGALTLEIRNANGRTFHGPITLSNNLTIMNSGDRISRFYGDITGVGTLTLTNASRTTRGTYMNLDMDSLNHEGDLQIDGVGHIEISAAIGGNVADITQNNSTYVFLSGNNDYTGALTVNAGTMIFRNLAAWSQNFGGVSAPSPVTVSNAGSALGVGMGGAGRFTDANIESLMDEATFGAGTGFAIETFANSTLNTALSGSQYFEKHAQPFNNPPALTMAGANTYKGGTRLTAGTLIAGVAENAGVSGPFGNPSTPAGSILFNGGGLGWSAANTTDYSSRFDISPGAKYIFNPGEQTVTLASALPVNGINGFDVIGDGTLVLSGANTYAGVTRITRSNGRISFSSMNRVVGGTATSHLGAPTTSANGTIWLGLGRDTGGQLIYTGTGETTDRIVALSGGGGGQGVIEHAGEGVLEFEGDATTGSAIALGGTTHNLILQGSSEGTGVVSGVISGRHLSPTVIKKGEGVWTLSGANTFVAKTAIQQGILSVNSLGDIALTPTVTTTAGSATVTASSTAGFEVGHSIESFRIPAGRTIASIVNGTTFTLNDGTGVTAGANQAAYVGFANSLGLPNLANSTIAIGNATTTGQLTYTGPAVTCDRVINLAGTTGGAILDQSGTGLLTFSSAFTATGAGSKTLTLQGSTDGVGEIAGAIVNNTAVHRTSVNKLGSGTWILSGVNTYTGPTTVSEGTLGGTGAIVSNVTVAAGAALAPGGLNTIGTLSVGGDVDFADGAQLHVSASDATADLLAVSGSVTGEGAVVVEADTTGSGPWRILTADDIEPTFVSADSDLMAVKLNNDTELWLMNKHGTVIVIQ